MKKSQYFISAGIFFDMYFKFVTHISIKRLSRNFRFNNAIMKINILQDRQCVVSNGLTRIKHPYCYRLLSWQLPEMVVDQMELLPYLRFGL